MKQINLQFPITVFFLLLATGICSCDRQKSVRTASGQVWNTFYNITYSSDRDLHDSIRQAMHTVELSLSPFCDSSLVSRINRGEKIRTDSLLSRIFEASKTVNRFSFGAFDPTVAPLINLWGFGYKNGKSDPTQEEIDSALTRVGIAGCLIDSAGYLVGIHPHTEYNFSAITKGYGCDIVGEMLARNGVKDYMVEIGGEIALKGESPRHAPWRIMIEAPVENDTVFVRERLAVIGITDCGVATSGNYRNHRTDASGHKRWHTISPVTGYPAETDMLSATVIAPTAMLADAYATSAMALPTDSAVKMFDKLEGISALLVTPDTIIATDGFPSFKD